MDIFHTYSAKCTMSLNIFDDRCESDTRFIYIYVLILLLLLFISCFFVFFKLLFWDEQLLADDFSVRKHKDSLVTWSPASHQGVAAFVATNWALYVAGEDPVRAAFQQFQAKWNKTYVSRAKF